MWKIFIPLILFNHFAYSNSRENKINYSIEIKKNIELYYQYKSAKQYKGGIAFVTVGNDDDCNVKTGNNRIQDAIDMGAIEVRIASNFDYQENIVITNPTINLILRGGFSDCTQAQNNNQNQSKTSLTRSSFATPIIRIENLPANNLTVIENLDMILGVSGGSFPGSGILMQNSSSDLILNNINLKQGNTSIAGALSVFNSTTNITLNDTNIFNNTAIVGAGIYCQNSNSNSASIVLNQGSNIFSNNVSSKGGGVYASGGCLFTSFSGSKVVSGQKGIFNNASDGDGGGIYLENGAKALLYGGKICNNPNECFGDVENPASLYGNQADVDASGFESGGGIYASGVGTSLLLSAVHVYDNHNDNGIGGAIALFDHAGLDIEDPRQEDSNAGCWDKVRCNYFNVNTARTGGVIYQASDDVINVAHAYFEDNRANSGMVLTLEANASVAFFTNVVINNNGANGTGGFEDNSVVEVNGNSGAEFKSSTFADNKYQSEVFNLTGGSSVINLFSSIVYDASGGNLFNKDSTSPEYTIDCLMAHELTTVLGANGNDIVANPLFVDSANRNYHLQATSPAIDFCYGGASVDIDFQPRGVDDPLIANFNNNLANVFDTGADEYSDIIFKNGFE